MNKLVLFALSALFAAALARGDDQISNAQTVLKTQGFYYGEVDGKFSPETSAALKRYQIRNGLDVTGTLTQQTLQALGLVAGKPRSAPAPAPPPPPSVAAKPAPAASKPPINLRRNDSVVESDRDFLRREDSAPASDDPSVVPPPAPLDTPATSADHFADVFARTPFANAPLEVQQSTVRKAQTFLARNGHYRETIDGEPGPAFEEALLTYQRRARLPLTGRLDLETLNKMRLLPGRSSGPPLQPFSSQPRSGSPSTTFRGIWID